MKKYLNLNFHTQVQRNIDNKFHKFNLNSIKKSPGKLSLFINDSNFIKQKNLRNNNLKRTRIFQKTREINVLKINNSKFAKKLNIIKFNKTLKSTKDSFYLNIKKIKTKNNKFLRSKHNSYLKKENLIFLKNIKKIKKEEFSIFKWDKNYRNIKIKRSKNITNIIKSN